MGSRRGRVWRLRATGLAMVVALLGTAACADAPQSLYFATIGDMGTGGPGQRRVADQLGVRADADPFDFILTVGDNFYPSGVLSVDDPQWVVSFENVYRAPSLQVPVRPILGNHDHQGFPFAQVEYRGPRGRWDMPAPYYSFTERLADGTEVAFFSLDTEPIRAGLDGTREPASLGRRMANVQRLLDWWGEELSDDLVRYIAERVHANDDFTVSRVLHIARATGRDVDERMVDRAIAASVEEDFEAQLEWLDRELAASSARWKIVVGHHPLYGHQVGRGHDPDMIARVEPILVRRGVDLYLAGHDHVTDFMKPVKGVHHVTAGEGAGDDHPGRVIETDESYFVHTGGGFTLYRVSPGSLEVEFVDLDGVTLSTLTIAK